MLNPIILDVECIVCNKTLQKLSHDPREVTRKMGKIANRRSRTPNWSLDEKQYLLELIKERKEVVVTKNNNGPNYSEEKDVAWNEILRKLADKFGNKFCGSSIKKVKTQWQNMKRIAREEISLIGDNIPKYSRQSLEVCNILEVIKDGMLKRDSDISNEAATMTANVEIKTECIDDEMLDVSQPSCSGIIINSVINTVENDQNKTNDNNQSSAGVSELSSESIEPERQDESVPAAERYTEKRHVSSMTDSQLLNDINVNPFHKEMQEFFRYNSAEKQVKMDALKEERQVVRVMRETAELNKIIAEQKLKHLLWMKKHEMT